MTDDLTTLLRDAGRGPTTDLDVEAVHSRGRRRAIGRRVAVGGGALALLGILAAGVVTLLDAPDTPLIDQAPQEDAAPTPDEGEDEGEGEDQADQVPPTAAMADLGVTAVDVVRSGDGAGGLALRVVTADGVAEEFTTAAGTVPPAGSRVVVTEDLRVWFNDADPNLLVGGPDDPVGGPGILARDGVGWVVIGESETGLPLVTQDVGVDEQFPADFEREVFVVEEDGEASGNGSVTGIPGVFGTFRDLEGQPFAADAVPEHLALLHGIGESSTVTLHPAGGEPIVLAETGGLDSWFVDVAFVEGEVWIMAIEGGATNLWMVSMDGEEVRRVPTPAGRATPAAGVELQVETGTDGTVAVLSTIHEDGSHGPAYRVDVEAARTAATRDATATGTEVPPGVFDVLDAAGTVHLLPPRSTDDGPLAACATDEDVPLNAPPAGPGGQVWWLCQDATSLLDDDVAYPFVATEVFSGGSGAMPAAGPRNIIETWAAGPPAGAVAAGLSGGLDPDVARIDDVAVDGSTVTVDLAPAEQVGVLGTTYASGALIHGLVGAALQYDELDTLRITLSGSCEAFSSLLEGVECREYGESFAPWNQ